LRLYSASAHVLVELLRVKEQHAAPWFVARDLALVRELVQVSFTDTQKPCGFVRIDETRGV